ncbi:hypothetical protein [Micromonospora sp. NPDC023737]|uniref:hypothetical protein n=1 Tax=unclassified Micromonospora TaxID=2617518 RepID=UPI0033EBE52F
MNPSDGGRPWQRPDRSDPVLPGPAHGAAALALLCAVVTPASWLAVATGVSALGDPEVPRAAGQVWVAAVAAFASLATGTLLVLLRRSPPLRRPVGAVAIAMTAVAAACALGVG